MLMRARNPHFPSPVVSKTPVRVSFGGGGTDLEAYYSRFGGLVISATIDKYFWCMLATRRDRRLVIRSADYDVSESCDQIGQLEFDGVLGLIKAVVAHFSPGFGLEVFTASDVSPGSGLGLSGAATVGTIKALSAITGRPLSKRHLAELASTIEIERLGRPIGKQDQYASAFGGLNEIRFSSDGVAVARLKIGSNLLSQLQSWTMLFFTGKSRDSASILQTQERKTSIGDDATLSLLHRIKTAAAQMREALLEGDVVGFGQLVHASWEAKRRIVQGISSSSIDRLYRLALDNGAIGGKVTGAGGGGFLMLICPPKAQPAVEKVLSREGIRRLAFRFVSTGSHLAN